MPGRHSRLQPVLERAQRRRSAATAAFWDAAERIPVLGLAVRAFDRERRAGGALLAAGVAYRLFFWLVPLGLFLAAAASFFTSSTSGGLESAAEKRGLVAVAAAAAQNALESGSHGAAYLLGLGLVFAVWFGYGVVKALNVLHALAWEVERGKVRSPLLAGVAFNVVAVALAAAAAAAARALGAIGLGPVAEAVTLVAVYGGAALGVSLLFPHAGAPVRALLPGAFLLSAGGIGMHLAVDLYLAPKLGRSVDVYGALGASTVILLWLYLIARLLTVSAFLNSTLYRAETGR